MYKQLPVSPGRRTGNGGRGKGGGGKQNECVNTSHTLTTVKEMGLGGWAGLSTNSCQS